jgi:hypothetical protein
MAEAASLIVIPAKVGTTGRPAETSRPEVPAFAGMTNPIGNRWLAPFSGLAPSPEPNDSSTLVIGV